jgi:hypothetical protein
MYTVRNTESWSIHSCPYRESLPPVAFEKALVILRSIGLWFGLARGLHLASAGQRFSIQWR